MDDGFRPSAACKRAVRVNTRQLVRRQRSAAQLDLFRAWRVQLRESWIVRASLARLIDRERQRTGCDRSRIRYGDGC
jgi:hypothetical protein